MAKKKLNLDEAPLLSELDFRAFERHKWADADCNGERLRLKRKLQSIGAPIGAYLNARGGDLTLRTSIHNPFTFNGYKVDSLWFYLAPSDKAKKPLRDLLGVDFQKDTDANYVHANLVLQVEYERINLGLRVHERAWWDVQNAKGRCSQREGAEEFASLLNAVKGDYVLTLHDWKQEYRCGSLKWDDIVNFFRYCEPGSHRMRVMRSIEKDDECLNDPTIYTQIAEEFESLLPVYDFLLWSPENNFLGMAK